MPVPTCALSIYGSRTAALFALVALAVAAPACTMTDRQQTADDEFFSRVATILDGLGESRRPDSKGEAKDLLFSLWLEESVKRCSPLESYLTDLPVYESGFDVTTYFMLIYFEDDLTMSVLCIEDVPQWGLKGGGSGGRHPKNRHLKMIQDLLGSINSVGVSPAHPGLVFSFEDRHESDRREAPLEDCVRYYCVVRRTAPAKAPP